MSREALTALSTTCIGLSGVSLLCGWYFIRMRKDMQKHRNAMLTATSLAALFLVFYVTRWASYGSKPFAGDGGWKIAYLTTLVPHIILAMAVGPLAARLLYLALRKRDYVAHRKLARVTFPIWLYVSVSGWVIYYLLYGRTY
jgi:putative membrane protein